MQDEALFQKIRQTLKKSHGEPSKCMELIECIDSMNKEGEAASYPRIVRRMWPQEWADNENKVEFELTKWDLLCKRRREINRRVFPSPMCFRFFIELSQDKKFKILTDPEEIHSKRQKELEWNLAREKSESNKENIGAEIIALKGKFHDWGIKEAQGIAETPGCKEPDHFGTENTGERVRTQRKRWLVPALAVALVILAVSITLTYIFALRSPAKLPLVQTPRLVMPERPSIAILPFTNVSGDPEQAYFSDGITEDIITKLSNVSGLFVISSNSSFLYRGNQVKIRKVANDLGVRYVLQGSIRRSGNKARITAQLIDGNTEQHVWADNYDRELKDIFFIQNEVAQKIVSELAVALTASERERPPQGGGDK